MQISDQGLQKIIQREGVILHAYQDSVGIWTIGTGHTSAAGSPQVTSGMVITQEQNEEILRNDLKPIEEQFSQHVFVPVTQNQYDAIISIVFNVGPRFWHSQCIQDLNAGHIESASQAIMQWCIPKEIIGRRKGEQQQFNTPDSTNPSVPDIGTINNNITEVTTMWTTLKQFFMDNFKTNLLPLGAASSAFFTHYWPYIVAGTIIVSGLIWLGFHLYERKINATVS
ncbi:MAG: lysozyme [Thaumarchaeota archaeon]|nr:lysozyme [Nitrososphaerota archaeon]